MQPSVIQFAPEIQKMLQQAKRERFTPKSLIMREGETPTALYFIISGSVSVLMEDEDGREIILSYLGPGEFFGELGLFGDEPKRCACVRTRTECEVAVVGYKTFISLYQETPELLRHLTGQIAEKLRATSRKVGNLAFLDVTGRIARALLDLAGDSQAITHPDGMLVRITREELGRLVNCSREIAGKVLRDLEQQGLIQVEGKSIVICNTR
jgi:CRP/FNR family transcriptional regulator, cyclic AMP receptor protein